MNKVYVALMDNGSGEEVIRGIHATHAGALDCLQRAFLEDRDEDDEEADEEAGIDPLSLDAINDSTPGTGASIQEVELGTDLYVQLDCGWE